MKKLTVITITIFLILNLINMWYNSKYVVVEVLANETWYFEDNYISYNETNIITNDLVKSVKYNETRTIITLYRNKVEK